MAKWINLFEKKARPEPAAQNGEVQSSPLPGMMISSHASVAESAPDQPPTAAEQAETEAAQIIENARQGAEEIRKRVTDTLKNVIDRAVADAEQASATIKIKAKAEAEEEAGRIILEARQKAEEMMRAGTPRQEPLRQPAKANIVEAEPGVKIITGKAEEKKQPSQFSAMSGKLSGMLNMKIGKKPGDADKPAEMSDKPVKASAENRPPRESRLSGLLNMKLGKNNQKESAVPAKPVAETTLPAKEMEASLPQPAAAPPVIEKPKVIEAKAPAAEHLMPAEPRASQQPGKTPESEPDPAALQKLDINAVYEGEVELSVAVPVDPVAVSRLYSYLQTTPDMKILYTRGSWEKGTNITISLDKPLPFFGMISKIQGIKITPGAYQKETAIKGTSSSLLGAKRSGVTRINIRLKSE